MKTRLPKILRLLALLLLSLSIVGHSQADEPADLQSQVRLLKKAVVALNRDLFLLEEELLFPGHTQVPVFLSLDLGEFFTLDSVQLKIDDKALANHLYTERELAALRRGGVQRLFLGNLKSGEHELVAFFTGLGPAGRDYRRATSLKFTKGVSPKLLELRIVDLEARQQPEFDVREWE
ncbi:MAG: AraC family transcriptional regulator [endosymbiont of Seepiophila jonesi]|uniref:AraC family transcriptional regulator n=1 Tax=endosymbiont of Lamellibrachia luymesi TaxID=2200907 RepID=A0A370DMI8_9GAMM|nr:MAG: AraC family transcriptional regulator [endosymbiont of Lamellibrachia luymesi]RDH90238.1 MAG: AraC family transcriptional regulator [endosymbiont of Seepiophila jonesi]